MNNIFKRYFKSVENSISRRLLRSVLSIYFIVTLGVTAAHVISEYFSTKDAVRDMLIASGETFHDILAADMWNYNYAQLSITAESMMRLPFITGIEVSISEEPEPMFSSNKNEVTEIDNIDTFWHEFPLSYSDTNVLHEIGKVKIYSNTTVVVDQIKSGLYILMINAIIKTAALLILVTVIFNRLLTRPLGKLAYHAESIDTDNPEYTPINIANNPRDELGQLQIAMNRMMRKTTESIQNLDSLNKDLEKRVLSRTEKLIETVSKLDEEKIALRHEVESRRKSERALSKSLAQLKQAQVKLIASEKMASLGMLSAGIAHEINNPISFVLNNVNVLGEYNEAFHILIKDYKLYIQALQAENSDAEEILSRIKEYEEEEDLEFIISDSLSLLDSTKEGISRVVEIVRNMKTFSHPDTETEHKVDVHEVVESTLLLLKNEIKSHIRIVKKLNANKTGIQCNRNQLGQVFLNIIMNAVQAMPEDPGGIIQLHTESDDQNLIIYITDNGCGIAEDKLSLIFDPFYTSKAVGEGTGMGLSISYSIVNKYNGKISVSSVKGKGTKFALQFPLEQ